MAPLSPDQIRTLFEGIRRAPGREAAYAPHKPLLLLLGLGRLQRACGGTAEHLPADHQRRHPRSISALLTTLTLLSAMAAPATMGLSRPAAARGMPTTL